MSRRPALLAVATCVAVLAVPSVAAAAPPPPACGATLTVDTVLRRDLTCAGDGLVLGPDVTLDLRGHTLRGSGAGVGLLVSSEGEVEIRNGTLTGWGTAVDTLGVEDADVGPLTVDRVRLRGNATGVDASGEDGTGRFRKPTTITRSSVVGHTVVGVDGGWFAEVAVDRTTVADNAVGLWSEGDATITRSRFDRNDRAVIGTEASVGVDGSSFHGNAQAVVTYGTGSTVVRGSRFVGSDVAVHGGGAVVDVRASTFTANGRAVVLGTWGGTVAGNVLRSNGEAIALDGGWLDGATVRDNVLRRNGEGIVLDPVDAATGVDGNDVRGSAGRGIHVPGATDLGGNTARGNGSSPQCVGVVCAAP